MRAIPPPDGETGLDALLWGILQEAGGLYISLNRYPEDKEMSWQVSMTLETGGSTSITRSSLKAALYGLINGESGGDGKVRCSGPCGRRLLPDEFGRYSNRHQTRESNPMGYYCKKCERERLAEWYERRGKKLRKRGIGGGRPEGEAELP